MTPRATRHPRPPTPVDGPSQGPGGVAGHPVRSADPGVVGVVLRVDGRWRAVRVSRDRWVRVEEAARILGVRSQVVRMRARRPGVVRVGSGRRGDPFLYRLSELAPEVAMQARPRPSGGAGGVGVSDAMGVGVAAA